MSAGQANIRPEQLNSVLGRHLSRAILAAVTADFLLAESERLTPGMTRATRAPWSRP